MAWMKSVPSTEHKSEKNARAAETVKDNGDE